MSTMHFTVRPAASAQWPALEDLFGRSGASNGCSCMYWARYLAPVDDLPVWSVPCFYVRSSHRGQGVMDALIEAALLTAATAGAPGFLHLISTSAAHRLHSIGLG